MELATLPEPRKCETPICWYGNQGLEIYQAWNLQQEEVTLTTLWHKREEFHKTIVNDLHTNYDMLKAISQSNASLDEWYKVQNKLPLWITQWDGNHSCGRHFWWDVTPRVSCEMLESIINCLECSQHEAHGQEAQEWPENCLTHKSWSSCNTSELT